MPADDILVPGFTEAPPKPTRGTRLSYAAGVAKNLPALTPMDHLRQRPLRGLVRTAGLGEPVLPAFGDLPPPAPAAPKKSLRQAALDDGVIPDAALQGRRLLDRYVLGEISRDEALAGFEAAAFRVNDVGPKAKSKLDRLFFARLDRIRPAVLPTAQDAVADTLSSPLLSHGTGLTENSQPHQTAKTEARLAASLPDTSGPGKEIDSIEIADAGGPEDLFPEIEKKGLTVNQYRVGKRGAELSRTIRKYINRERSNGKSLADGAELFGLIGEALQSKFTTSVFGKKADQARQELFETFNRYLNGLSESVEGYVAETAVENGLTEEDAEDFGRLFSGVFVALAATVAHGKRGGKKSDRKAGQEDDTPDASDPVSRVLADETGPSRQRRQRREEFAQSDADDGIHTELEPDYWTKHTNFGELFAGSTTSGRDQLRRNMLDDKSLGLEDFAGWQAHHLIPWDLRNRKLLKDLDFDVNHQHNGISLPTSKAGALSEHMGPHEFYNEGYEWLLTRLDRANLPKEQKKKLLVESIERTRQTLLGGLPQLRRKLGGTDRAWYRYFDALGDSMDLPEIQRDD